MEVNEGDDLELSVLIEAYPHITKHRWDTPISPNTATQEHKLIRYNNRWTKIASWERNVQSPYSSFWYLSSTVRKVQKSSVLQEEEVLLNLRFAVLAFCVNLTRSLYFLRSWNSKREEYCSLFISPMMHRSCLNSSHQVSHFWFCRYSSFSPFIFVLDTMLFCSWREWTYRSRASTPFMLRVKWPMHPSHFKSRCIVSDRNTN